MAEYSFEREARTPYSEVFTIESDDGSDVGRVDLHYTPSITYATLCVGEALTEEMADGDGMDAGLADGCILDLVDPLAGPVRLGRAVAEVACPEKMLHRLAERKKSKQSASTHRPSTNL